MNITAAPTETSSGIGRPPYASERIRSHVLYMHETRAQQDKLVRSCSTCRCLPFDGSSRNHQLGKQRCGDCMQAGKQSGWQRRNHKGRGNKRQVGKWGCQLFRRKDRKEKPGKSSDTENLVKTGNGSEAKTQNRRRLESFKFSLTLFFRRNQW